MARKLPRNPMQPVVIGPGGSPRFKANEIVRALLDFANECGFGLNEIAKMRFTRNDRRQFAELIGYTIRGYHELDYVSDDDADSATRAARRVQRGFQACRDRGCKIHRKIRSPVTDHGGA